MAFRNVNIHKTTNANRMKPVTFDSQIIKDCHSICDCLTVSALIEGDIYKPKIDLDSPKLVEKFRPNSNF